MNGRHPVWIWSGATLTLALACFAFFILARHSQSSASSDAATKLGNYLSASGALPAADFAKTQRLMNLLDSGGSLNSSDVDWLISLTTRPGTEAQLDDRNHVVSGVFSECRYRDSISAGDAGKVVNFAAQLLSSKDPGPDEWRPMYACLILGRLKDPRGLPFLRELSSYPDNFVRPRATTEIRDFDKPAPRFVRGVSDT